MPRMIAFLVAAIALCSCAPTLQSGNERGGVIRLDHAKLNMSVVMSLADQHCAQFGKLSQVAIPDSVQTDTVPFTCVTR